MFHAGRLAEAFVKTSGTDAATDFEQLKVFSALLAPVSKMLFGKAAAQKVREILLRNTGAESEKAVLFISFLIFRNWYKYINPITEKIQKILDEQNNTLVLTLETATEPDAGFKNELEKTICRHTGASEIRMKTQLVPELLSGYRLRIGGLCIDASLRRQIKNLTEDLLNKGQFSAVS